MPEPRIVSREIARRYLALHHLLAPARGLPPEPDSVERVMARLGSIQFDPLGVAGRNHDLVLHARIAGYRPGWTDDLLYRQRRLFEAHNKALCLLPIDELPYYRIAWDRAGIRHERETWGDHGTLAEHILARISAEGPLSSADFEGEPAIDWYWGPTNRARAVLEALWESGRIGLARREGNRRFYDLAERLFPAELLARRVPEREQLRHKLLSRYRAHGLLGSTGSPEVWLGVNEVDADGRRTGSPIRAGLLAELVEQKALLPVEITGLRGLRYVLADEAPTLDQAEAEVAAGLPPGALSAAPAIDAHASADTVGSAGLHAPAPSVAFLAPLDPFCWDRAFLAQLYDFDYRWEVYVPEAKRRWGYYVLPILYGDRLVGRIEPRIDRAARTVTILGLWTEAGADLRGSDAFVAALREALADYLAFAGARRLIWRSGLGGWARRVGHPRPPRIETGARSPRVSAGGLSPRSVPSRGASSEAGGPVPLTSGASD